MKATIHTESGSVYRFTEDNFSLTQCVREGASPCHYKSVEFKQGPELGKRMVFSGILWNEEAMAAIRLTSSTPVTCISLEANNEDSSN